MILDPVSDQRHSEGNAGGGGGTSALPTKWAWHGCGKLQSLRSQYKLSTSDFTGISKSARIKEGSPFHEGNSKKFYIS